VAFEPLVSSFLPCHQPQQWLPVGVVLARMRTVVWALIALDMQPLSLLASDSIYKCGFSARIACIRFQTFVYRQLSDRRPSVLLPTPSV